MKEKRENPGDLLQGTLDLLILKALARGAMHGYGVAEWIHQTSEDILKVEEGALYPALHRLELRGLLSSEWGTSDNNRRAKFYSLTASGRKQLAQETEFWRACPARCANTPNRLERAGGDHVFGVDKQNLASRQSRLESTAARRDFKDEVAFHLAMREEKNR